MHKTGRSLTVEIIGIKVGDNSREEGYSMLGSGKATDETFRQSREEIGVVESRSPIYRT